MPQYADDYAIDQDMREGVVEDGGLSIDRMTLADILTWTDETGNYFGDMVLMFGHEPRDLVGWYIFDAMGEAREGPFQWEALARRELEIVRAEGY